MARYIDADLLIQEIKEETPLNWTDSERELQEQLDYRIFKHMVDYQPTADVAEVRRGEWKKTNSRKKSYMYDCSVCGKTAYFCGMVCAYDFCPNCGADMRGKEDEV